MSSIPAWIEGFPGAITVCDAAGIIVYVNETSARYLAADGGRDLIGQNMLDCHPEYARTMLADMMATQREHIYTVEKNGVKKQVYQTPWYENGEYRGFVELLLPLPADMPHIVRGKPAG